MVYSLLRSTVGQLRDEVDALLELLKPGYELVCQQVPHYVVDADERYYFIPESEFDPSDHSIYEFIPEGFLMAFKLGDALGPWVGGATEQECLEIAIAELEQHHI